MSFCCTSSGYFSPTPCSTSRRCGRKPAATCECSEQATSSNPHRCTHFRKGPVCRKSQLHLCHGPSPSQGRVAAPGWGSRPGGPSSECAAVDPMTSQSLPGRQSCRSRRSSYEGQETVRCQIPELARREALSYHRSGGQRKHYLPRMTDDLSV